MLRDRLIYADYFTDVQIKMYSKVHARSIVNDEAVDFYRTRETHSFESYFRRLQVDDSENGNDPNQTSVSDVLRYSLLSPRSSRDQGWQVMHPSLHSPLSLAALTSERAKSQENHSSLIQIFVIFIRNWARQNNRSPDIESRTKTTASKRSENIMKTTSRTL